MEAEDASGDPPNTSARKNFRLRKSGGWANWAAAACSIPEEWGGAGADTITYVLMLEEVARVDASMAVALSVTNSVVAWPLWRHGTKEQRRKYLPRLARGEIIGAILPDRAAGRIGCGGDSDARGARRRAISAERDEELGHERRRRRRLHRFCEDGSCRRRARRDRFSGGAELLRLSRQPLRR